MDSATSFSVPPSAVYETRPANRESRTRPPWFSLVFVGINGFWGSPAQALTTPLDDPPDESPDEHAVISTAVIPSATAPVAMREIRKGIPSTSK